MKYKRNHFIGRIVSYILSFCMTFIMIPMTVHAQMSGQDDISIEAIGADMTVYFNDEKIGGETNSISGIGRGYIKDGKNDIKIVVSNGFDNIASVKINNQKIILSNGITNQIEFAVDAASSYRIVLIPNTSSITKKTDKNSVQISNSKDMLSTNEKEVKTDDHNKNLGS